MNKPMVFEASDLRIKPGRWPQNLTLPNGLVVTLSYEEIDDEGDLMFVDYVNGDVVARIFND